MNIPANLRNKFAELKRVSSELNALIENRSFYRLSFIKRYAWIRKVKKLYNGLRGPVSEFRLQHILAAVAVVILGSGCPSPGGGGGDGSGITPTFAAAVTNPFALADVGILASPCFADIDNDGDMDAFLGEGYGNTLYFENTGFAFLPNFAAAVTNPFGLADVGFLASPCFADMDNDGDLDAFIGNSDGNTLYFENTGSALAPAFAAAVENPFGLADVGWYSSPCFADIDNDGDLDAFIGERYGNTLYFENTGTASAPAFAAAVTNPFGLADVGLSSSPCFADIDDDGDMDAFIGNSHGNTLYFENTGTASAPAFAAAVTNPFGLADVGIFASPCFADMDNDGDMDAFIGERYGNNLYFLNTAL